MLECSPDIHLRRLMDDDANSSSPIVYSIVHSSCRDNHAFLCGPEKETVHCSATYREHCLEESGGGRSSRLCRGTRRQKEGAHAAVHFSRREHGGQQS